MKGDQISKSMSMGGGDRGFPFTKIKWLCSDEFLKGKEGRFNIIGFFVMISQICNALAQISKKKKREMEQT